MAQIAKVTEAAHPKHNYWFLIVRDGTSQCAGNFLDGTGTVDPTGEMIPKAFLGQRFNCPDTSLDRSHNAFLRFPTRVYGPRTVNHASGEYEIQTVNDDALPAGALSIRSGRRVVNKTSKSAYNGGSGGGTAVLEAPPVVVAPKVVPKPKPVVRTTRKVNPSVIGLALSPADGAPVVSIDKIALFLDKLSVKRPLMIWGPAGIGKSDVVQDWTHEQDKTMYDWRLSNMDPTIINGLGVPDFNEQVTKFLPLDNIPKGPNCVLFLDEITTAPPSIQALAYQITLNRTIGSTPLPDDCLIVLAGNRTTDRGVAYQMPSPLANRCRHVTVKPDIKNWRNWALSRGIDARIVSFLTLRSEDFLHKMVPTTSGEAWPSPRSWAACHEVLNSDLDAVDQGIGIATEVGCAAAREFIKFCDGYDHYVRKLDDILNGLAKDLVITDPAQAQVVVVAAVANCTDDPEILENVISWLKSPKLNDEYRNLGLRGLAERFGEDVLQTIPSYTGAEAVQDDGLSWT
jgi:MoxR-like ATPase